MAHKNLAKAQGLKAKGTLISPVISVDRQEIAVWYGGKEPKISVSLPSSNAAHIVAAPISQGIRVIPSIVVAQADGTGIVISPKLQGAQTIESVAQEVARAIGFPTDQIEVLGS